jgi:predicted N-acetyltransferase YhbS
MSVQFEKAKPEDYGDVIDFGNYVFSQSHISHDFPVILPKLYRREYFMDGIHYIAREEGRIRAAVGAYPLEMRVPGDLLPGRGIGMVSVHPYYRSRGFMRVLMNMALEDMKRDGMVFSCLGGQRQRYEYFGYIPTGNVCCFECGRANIIHTLGREFKTPLALRRINAGDTDLLDRLHAMHEAKPVHVLRRRDRLFDIISSWKSQAFAVMEGRRVEGYLLYRPDERLIHEINLEDNARIAELIGLFLEAPEGSGSIRVRAGIHEREKIAALAGFAERYSLGSAYSFALFDYPRFILPFLRLKKSGRTLPGGTFRLQIEGGPRLALGVSGGEVSAAETREPADLGLPPLEALRFLFSAGYAAGSGTIAENPFLQSLLPLPLSFEAADGV